jgi:hypothetical protein
MRNGPKLSVASENFPEAIRLNSTELVVTAAAPLTDIGTNAHHISVAHKPAIRSGDNPLENLCIQSNQEAFLCTANGFRESSKKRQITLE